MFKFHEDERVMLICADSIDLPVGSVGTVFCMYATDPPAYEVTFDLEGQDYGAIVDEADLKAVEELPVLARVSASGSLAA